MALDFRIVPRGKKFPMGYSELFSYDKIYHKFFGKCHGKYSIHEAVGVASVRNPQCQHVTLA